MKIILLSGGSGKRLWPLSNGVRSKQFLKLFDAPDGSKESMVQRVARQIHEAGIAAEIVVATSKSQQDSIVSQLGEKADIVAEPMRRDTFPAIALVTAYLTKEKGIPDDEVVIVMPSDSFTESGYFEAIKQMADAVANNTADLVLMGIKPEKPSSKFGYIVPSAGNPGKASHFVEKPLIEVAEKLIQEGALWNGGVFAFRLGYLKNILDHYTTASSFEEIRNHYENLPKISFDYEVVEKAKSIGIVKFEGKWKDLGTWDSIANELRRGQIGNVVSSGEPNLIINELSLPLICNGVRDAIVVASPDGILVSDMENVDAIKPLVERIESRPMYEERRWGVYTVLKSETFDDGYSVLTKEIVINPGCSISYQRHFHREEVWTIIDGTGEIILDGIRHSVRRGDIFNIAKGQLHSIKADKKLTIIEIQKGEMLSEEDIERLPFPG